MLLNHSSNTLLIQSGISFKEWIILILLFDIKNMRHMRRKDPSRIGKFSNSKIDLSFNLPQENP